MELGKKRKIKKNVWSVDTAQTPTIEACPTKKYKARVLRVEAYRPGFDSASNRNEYQESLKKKIKKPGGKMRLARSADNLAAFY
jgi:hypothetical protein